MQIMVFVLFSVLFLKKYLVKAISAKLVCLMHPLCKIRSFYFISKSILSDKQRDRPETDAYFPRAQDRHILFSETLPIICPQSTANIF